MSSVTVTMPIRDYEEMKKEIARLKDLSIYNYIDKEYRDIVHNDYTLSINTDAIKARYDSDNGYNDQPIPRGREWK